MNESFLTSWREVQKEIHQNAVDKGFWKEPRNEGEIIALIHSELSEGLEALRTDAMDDKIPSYKGIVAELADAVIRIMDYAEGFEYDVASAIILKMRMNENRKPKHGKKF